MLKANLILEIKATASREEGEARESLGESGRNGASRATTASAVETLPPPPQQLINYSENQTGK